MLSRDDVKHIARLAKLSLKPQEREKFKSQLERVLGYFKKIQEMKIERAKASYQLTEVINRFREDKVETSRMLSQREALSQAKKSRRGYFVIERILG